MVGILARINNIVANPFRNSANYVPPIHDKTPQEADFLENALKKNFLFEDLSKSEIVAMILAFEKVSHKAKTTLIQQGDTSDFFYVIYEGKCTFHVDGDLVGDAEAKGSFGELELLYLSPRIATVTTVVDTTLYRMDSRAFRHIPRNFFVKKSFTSKKELLMGISFFKENF